MAVQSSSGRSARARNFVPRNPVSKIGNLGGGSARLALAKKLSKETALRNSGVPKNEQTILNKELKDWTRYYGHNLFLFSRYEGMESAIKSLKSTEPRELANLLGGESGRRALANLLGGESGRRALANLLGGESGRRALANLVDSSHRRVFESLVGSESGRRALLRVSQEENPEAGIKALIRNIKKQQKI